MNEKVDLILPSGFEGAQNTTICAVGGFDAAKLRGCSSVVTWVVAGFNVPCKRKVDGASVSITYTAPHFGSPISPFDLPTRPRGSHGHVSYSPTRSIYSFTRDRLLLTALATIPP